MSKKKSSKKEKSLPKLKDDPSAPMMAVFRVFIWAFLIIGIASGGIYYVSRTGYFTPPEEADVEVLKLIINQEDLPDNFSTLDVTARKLAIDEIPEKWKWLHSAGAFIMEPHGLNFVNKIKFVMKIKSDGTHEPIIHHVSDDTLETLKNTTSTFDPQSQTVTVEGTLDHLSILFYAFEYPGEQPATQEDTQDQGMMIKIEPPTLTIPSSGPTYTSPPAEPVQEPTAPDPEPTPTPTPEPEPDPAPTPTPDPVEPVSDCNPANYQSCMNQFSLSSCINMCLAPNNCVPDQRTKMECPPPVSELTCEINCQNQQNNHTNTCLNISKCTAGEI